MRGRASGFGARISSMGLLIVVIVLSGLIGHCVIEIHWADNLLDERNLVGGEAVFRVEVFVRPPRGPLLDRYEGINFASDVLGWLVQKYKEARQPTGEVGQDTFRFALRVERANAQIRFR